jgi:hypothetical protein
MMRRVQYPRQNLVGYWVELKLSPNVSSFIDGSINGPPFRS